MTAPEGLPVISWGAHVNPRNGACVMEYVSILAGERFNDHPMCTHPILAHVARTVNDVLSQDGRQKLLPLIARLIGTGEPGDFDDDHGTPKYDAERYLNMSAWLNWKRASDGYLAVSVTGLPTEDEDQHNLNFLAELIDAYDHQYGRTPEVLSAESVRLLACAVAP